MLLHKPRILVVDDEVIAREVLRRRLEKSGYACAAVPNAADADELLKHEEFNLMILDIVMPGKSGIDYLPEVVARYRDTAVVMLTADGDTSTVVKAMREGAYDYITKPVDHDELISKIGRALERRAAGFIREYQDQLEQQVARRTLEQQVARRTQDHEGQLRKLAVLNNLFQEHLGQFLVTQESYKRFQTTVGESPLLQQRSRPADLESQGVASIDLQTTIDAVASAAPIEEPELRPHTAPDGTVTILFSDIEGFTQMTERLGDQRAQQVLRGHNDIVRHQVAAHGGFEVKSSGDGFMLAFSSARRAIQCSIAIQRAFAAHIDVHADEPIRVRIGLHTGELIREMEDFFGKNVIVASRIADQAQGGEILVSALLKELTESGGDIRFVRERGVELKGLAGVNRVYSVVWE